MSDKRFQQVDDALRTYPLRPAPGTLAPQVAARLRALYPAPQFRLMWTDYAISLFAAGMLGLVFFGWQLLTPQMLLQLQFRAWLIVEHIGVVGGAALVGGLLLAGAALVLAAFILARPFAGRYYLLRGR